MKDHLKQERQLIARGVLTPPLKKRPALPSWPAPVGNVSEEAMEQLWHDEREGR